MWRLPGPRSPAAPPARAPFPDARNLCSAASDGLRRETAVVQLRRQQSEAGRANGWARTRTHTQIRRMRVSGLCPYAPAPLRIREPRERQKRREEEEKRERERVTAPYSRRLQHHPPRSTSDERLSVRAATPRNQSKCQKRATAHAPARPAPSNYARSDAIPIARADPIRSVPMRPDPIRFDLRESFTASNREVDWNRYGPAGEFNTRCARTILFRRHEINPRLPALEETLSKTKSSRLYWSWSIDFLFSFLFSCDGEDLPFEDREKYLFQERTFIHKGG